MFKASTLQLELKSMLLLLLDYDTTVNEGDVCAARNVVDMSHVLTCAFPPRCVPGWYSVDVEKETATVLLAKPLTRIRIVWPDLPFAFFICKQPM